MQLRRWKRLGVRVSSGKPLCRAVADGHIDVARLLVEGLGADVSHAANGDLDDVTPLVVAALNGNVPMVRVLVNKLGANVNQATQLGVTPLLLAVERNDVAMARCLVKELGADVNQANQKIHSPLYFVAAHGHFELVRVLVDELDANINHTSQDGTTQLLYSWRHVIRWLANHGADLQASNPRRGTAADVSRSYDAPAEQIVYLEAKAHCSNPGCDGVELRKCQGCEQVRYCGVECGLAHWPLHKAKCKRIDKA